jgi:diguanylate cyclase (GGDEF)-like protein
VAVTESELKKRLSDGSQREVERQVREAQARALLEQGGTGAVGSSLAAIFTVAGLWGEVPSKLLSTWLAVLVSIQLGRLLLSFAVTRKGDRVDRWSRVNLQLIWASALAWGVGAFVLWPESTLHQVILPMTLVGISAAGSTAYSAVRTASVPFGVVVILPLAARFAYEGTPVHVLIGALALIYLALILRVGASMRRTSTEALSARFENQVLAAKAEAVSEELAEQTMLLQRLVRLDGLTQIANRREFDEFYEREWRRAARNAGSISILMCDIDHFKKYNDSYGHLAGDDCLKAVAETLSAALQRATELVARYGGEEFVVVLGETDLEEAAETAERLRKKVSEIAIPHADSSTASHVTISIGVATTVPKAEDEPASLVQAADAALYEAKEAGRDRVVSCRLRDDQDDR